MVTLLKGFSCVLIIIFFTALPVMAKESITFEDFFSMNRLGSPVVSPDGKTIAFTIKKANIDENTYITQIWLINSDGSNLKQFTTHTTSSTTPQFSHNGENVYFLSKRSGQMQLWMKPVEGGQAVQQTDVYNGIVGYRVSPQGNQFLLIRKVPPDCPSEDCIRQKGEDEKSSKVKARVIDHLMYRHWNEWLEGKYSHLFLFSKDNGKLTDLTPGPIHVPTLALGSSHDYCFSPDGKKVAYVTNKEMNTAASTNNDIYLLILETGESKKISISLGNDNNPHFSPDGRYIAYASMERAGFEADRQRLMLFDTRTAKTIELTAGSGLSATDIQWGPDSKNIYFTENDRGYIAIYKVNILSADISPVLKGHELKGIQCIDNDHLVFLKQTTRMPYELFVYDLKSKKLEALTHFNKKVLAKYDLPPYEEFWFKGAQGDSVHGFIMKPPNYEEGKQYPTVHMIHGGPQGMWSDEWHFRWNYQMFAAPGYAVYFINFHGSKGYGQKFTDSISRHWGDLPYEDLVKGTEYVLNNYDFVDPNRLAAAGASYGGFMVNWIAGHDNPYKCLVSHDGSYDQKSMWGETEELWFPEWEMGGLPWEKGTTYEQWSPSRLAPNFKTPMLVIHGEHDYRLAYTQSLQLFTALQRQGVPSRLLFFPDEDHFVRKPLNAQLWWKTVHDWLATYLK
jgi:dipeptidyl aminopeptidase/acylaminoacyl peptidase